MSHNTEVNKAFWNEQAATYDTRHEKTLAAIVEEIRARREFIGVQWVEDDHDGDEHGAGNSGKPRRAVRLLDYACGTGTITRALVPYTTQCVGIDLSEEMVATYNARAQNQGLTKEQASAHHGNLTVPSDPDPPAFAGPDFWDFDVAAVGLGFHHFDDPELAAARLARRLRPGGVLLILDFLAYDPLAKWGGGGEQEEQALKTVTHHGFTEGRIRSIFEAAGAGEGFGLEVVREVAFGEREEKRRTLFMARGTKVVEGGSE
ncbi:S-adenosyl-L-methionine-dependent methyltransferase [Pleurostoma richardsiae]|uniref:S-adenosyl-L-methionine-dependent methyltransferase n=1 Tax=Pleurostoma richardsiae TaxID=41990 RepID=A0AA38VP26_9PEZI|nr:S-adenosyl-L-methionine-dependent methyltransferase [Pleurostoma richardsiae]